MAAGVIDVGQQLFGLGHLQQDGVGRGQGDGVQVGRIGGGRHDGRVARPQQGQAEVAEALLRAQADDHFPLRVQPHAVDCLKYLLATSRRRLRMPIASL